MIDRPVRELIKPGPVDCLEASMTVMAGARKMAEVRRGAMPVLEGDRLVGMFSERDLMLRVVLAGKDPEQTLVSEVMTRELVVAQSDSTNGECLNMMLKMHFRHLPIVQGDELVGLLSLRDLHETESDRKSQEIQMLNYYVHYCPDQK